MSPEPEVGYKSCPAPISRLRVEKVEGGILVAGVVVAANCQIALPVFGSLFILVGIVLTVASYRGPGQDEEPENYAARLAFTGNSRILGPACIAVGFIMFSAGITLCFLARKARKKERRVGFHCPIHGDFYPFSSMATTRAIGKFESNLGLCFGRARSLAMEGISQTIPQCPHAQMSSTRSSFSAPLSPCPTPMPFLVTSNSNSSDLVVSVGGNMSPDQTFGSIRSLSVSREVASFPLSRTPSPPHRTHTHERSCSLSESTAIQKTRRDLIKIENEIAQTKSFIEEVESGHFRSNRASIELVTAKLIESPLLVSAQNNAVKGDTQSKNFIVHVSKGSGKSVSIVVPKDEME